MKIPAVFLLVWAMMVLTGNASVPAESEEEAEGEPDLEKRSILCSSGWIASHGRCLLFETRTMNWADAEKNCQFHGGHLASVHSFDEYHVIQSLILRQTNTYPLTWLGGSDAQQEGTWLWSDGSSFRYANWAPGQPDNYQSSHCMVMNYGAERKSDDQWCSNQRASVCAKNA